MIQYAKLRYTQAEDVTMHSIVNCQCTPHNAYKLGSHHTPQFGHLPDLQHFIASAASLSPSSLLGEVVLLWCPHPPSSRTLPVILIEPWLALIKTIILYLSPRYRCWIRDTTANLGQNYNLTTLSVQGGAKKWLKTNRLNQRTDLNINCINIHISYKLFGRSKNFPDNLEHFQIVNFSLVFSLFFPAFHSNDPETFQTVKILMIWSISDCQDIIKYPKGSLKLLWKNSFKQASPVELTPP